ncbi:hypothetical protein RD792_004585 [Penstemon davidsonii]|uniref:RRM domain-containing protein n=1 Tax=Penstemon davidsonii TaxID=160366 RepID=A0ABR0DIR6_9LAMI|nr:hypothetical protein RD792_004585 [Penstemon davidsonii]
MNEPGFSFPRYHHHLDPRAQEFFPTTGTNLPSFPPNIYYPYPPPIYDNMVHPQPPYEVPPPPLPENLPPSPTTPSRTLFLTMVPPSVSESTIRRDLEIFGDVRAVEMERRRQGLITVHFYDVRDAQTALVAIQQQHMQQQFRLGRHYESVFNNSMGLSHPPPPPPFPTTARGLISGRVVWAQYTTPVTSGLPEGCNQGTLVVFNLDSRVSVPYLKQIFEPFGPVKELRETPRKKNQKFVEFYDVRNAAVAMAEMNGREIYGKSIVVDFSRPGGQSKKLQKGPLIPTKLNNNNNHSPRSSIPSSPSTPPQSRWRKAVGGSGKSTSSSTGSSVQESMNNLCIGSNRKNISFKNSGGGGRPWKGGGRHGGKEYDPRFLINIEDGTLLSESNSSRTTVMIKNIPNKYSQKLLLNMLDNHCIHCNEQIAADGEDQPLSSYDFVYLPIDFM